MIPAWLPGCCVTDGEWTNVVATLYEVFRRDFVLGRPCVDGYPVWWQRRMSDGCEQAFWHLITRDDASAGQRLFDPRRAERLSWCGAILRNCNDPAITRWRYRESNGQIRLYLWLEPGDYVVVLEERDLRAETRQVYFLVTAYYVDGEGRRKHLRKKYQRGEP